MENNMKMLLMLSMAVDH